MHPRWRTIFMSALTVVATTGCTAFRPTDVSWIDGTPSDRGFGQAGVLNIRWSKDLGPEQGGPYIPVENASAAFDHIRDRLYIGSSDGRLYAFDSHGRRYFSYDPEAGIEATPVVDTRLGQVYVVGEDGRVHALEPNGDIIWVGNAGGTVRESPVIEDTVIYIAREDDAVVAMDRENGEVFWTYRREGTVEFSVSGHAGLLLTDTAVITGFSDGTVTAIDKASGNLLWERITAVDVEPEEGAVRQFFDVDSTPVLHDGVVYAASFTAGLYAIDPMSGSVIWREAEMIGITGIAARGRMLILASALQGVTAYDLRHRQLIWRHENESGAPTTPIIAEPYVLIGETLGGLKALRLAGGEEIARIDVSTGFSAAPLARGRYGFAISNGGRVFAFVI